MVQPSYLNTKTFNIEIKTKINSFKYYFQPPLFCLFFFEISQLYFELGLGLGLGDFPESSAGEESTCNVGELGSIPGLRRSPGEGKGYPLQYCGLENSMGCIVYGVTESDMMSDFHF